MRRGERDGQAGQVLNTEGPQVICLGETMAQIVPADGRSLADAETFAVHAAGAESNVARALVQLGTGAAWVSRLGTDPWGDRVLADIADAGVDVTGVTRTGQRTGLFAKDPGPTGSRVYYYRDGSAASRMDPGDIDAALARRPRLLHLSGITPALSATCRAAVEHAVTAAPAAGVLLSFDVNYRPVLWRDRPGRDAPAELAELARAADVCLVGLDEAETVWGTATMADVRRRLAGSRHLVVKDSDRQAVEFTGGAATAVPALGVPVAEPVGAGDAFAAGWIHGLLRGFDATTRLRLGHLTAAAALAELGDHFRLPTPGTALEAMAQQQQWPPITNALRAEGEQP